MIKIITIIILQMAIAKHTCEINTAATGKVKYRGDTMEDAMYKTVKECYINQVLDYGKKYKAAPSTDRRILFLEYCTNNVYCKETK